MVKLENVKVGDYQISVAKLVGKSVKDVYGYISMEFGQANFKMTRVVFEDDTVLYCEGEHDFPYLVDYDAQPNFDEETLYKLYKENEEE